MAASLDFKCENSAIGANKNEIDLMVAVSSAEMTHLCFRRLCGNADAESDERLEEAAEKCPRLRSYGGSLTVKQ